MINDRVFIRLALACGGDTAPEAISRSSEHWQDRAFHRNEVGRANPLAGNLHFGAGVRTCGDSDGWPIDVSDVALVRGEQVVARHDITAESVGELAEGLGHYHDSTGQRFPLSLDLLTCLRANYIRF